MDLGHAEVIFALVVGKWDERIGHEPEGFGFEVAEALQQVAGLGLSGAPRFAGLVMGNHERAFAIASGQDIAVPAEELFGGGFVQAAAGLDGGVVGFQQQQLHLQGPPLPILLPCAFEFAQVVSVAEEVFAVELKVTSELLTYPSEDLSAFCHLEKPATANRMRRSVPGKTVSVWLRVSQRAATACDR